MLWGWNYIDSLTFDILVEVGHRFNLIIIAYFCDALGTYRIGSNYVHHLPHRGEVLVVIGKGNIRVIII